MDSLRKAREDALTKIYLDIAMTGKPTESQASMVRYLEAKESEPTFEKVSGLFDADILSYLIGGARK